MIEIKYKESYNKHLKLIDENDNEILEKIIKYLIKTLKKEILSVLNIGGGFVKANEKFLSNHPNINYYVLDIQNSENQKNIINADITDSNFKSEYTFDFIYSYDTFEHILNPWDATKNIKNLLNINGIIFCAAPFSWRYHACPYDTYRYSHTGLRYIFEYLSEIKPVFAGYRKKSNNKGWYIDKTDVTLDGKEFTESIETYYIGQKDANYTFDLSNFDKGWRRK